MRDDFLEFCEKEGEVADKILHQIENCHGRTLNESRYGLRMRGEG